MCVQVPCVYLLYAASSVTERNTEKQEKGEKRLILTGQSFGKWQVKLISRLDENLKKMAPLARIDFKVIDVTGHTVFFSH